MTLYNYRIVYPLLHEVPQMEDIFIFHNQNANVTIVHEEGVRQLGCWSSFTPPHSPASVCLSINWVQKS